MPSNYSKQIEEAYLYFCNFFNVRLNRKELDSHTWYIHSVAVLHFTQYRVIYPLENYTVPLQRE